jgi:hypothetical protein
MRDCSLDAMSDLMRRPVSSPDVTVRLIAVDLDGTLVETGVLDIGERDRSAIAAAVRAGIAVVLATARTPAAARQFQRELGITGPVIGNNGAYVLDADGTELLHHRIEPGCASRIISQIQRADLYPTLIDGDRVFRRRRPTESLGQIKSRVKFCEWTIDLVNDLRPCIGAGPTTIGLFAPGVHQHVEALASEPVCALRYYDGEAMSGVIFMNAGASKGDALQSVCAALSIEPRDTLAIGDAEADLSMFDFAGVAVAVANATREVRAAADWIAPSQVEQGVAAAIERFALAPSGRR